MSSRLINESTKGRLCKKWMRRARLYKKDRNSQQRILTYTINPEIKELKIEKKYKPQNTVGKCNALSAFSTGTDNCYATMIF